VSDTASSHSSLGHGAAGFSSVRTNGDQSRRPRVTVKRSRRFGSRFAELIRAA
jgi:hypothetical protein